MTPDLANVPTVTAVCALALFRALESRLPFVTGQPQLTRHAARNLSLGLLNVGTMALLAGPLFVGVSDWAERSGVGLLAICLGPFLMGGGGFGGMKPGSPGSSR